MAHFMNELWFIGQTGLGIVVVLFAARWHPSWLVSTLPVLPMLMNLFVGKVILLWGQSLPSGDPLMIFYSLGLNLLTHRQGPGASQKVLLDSWRISLISALLMLCHLGFQGQDASHAHHAAVFGMNLFVQIISWVSFYASQILERRLLIQLLQKHAFVTANFFSGLFGQALDMMVFTSLIACYLGLEWNQCLLWSMKIRVLLWTLSSLGAYFV